MAESDAVGTCLPFIGREFDRKERGMEGPTRPLVHQAGNWQDPAARTPPPLAERAPARGTIGLPADPRPVAAELTSAIATRRARPSTSAAMPRRPTRGVAAREDPGSRREVAAARPGAAGAAVGSRPNPGRGPCRRGAPARGGARPGRDQGAGARRRPRQGRRREARRLAGRGRGDRRPRSSAWTSRASRSARCSSRRRPTS